MMDKSGGEQALKHLLDLSAKAYNKGIDIYSDFLNMQEVALLKSNREAVQTGRYFLWGGIEDSERVMACFPAEYTDDLYTERFPITCLHVIIKGARFLSKELTHRDYMGAVLGLGIERKLIGDIILDRRGEVPGAFVFCADRISDFIISELNKIGRADVTVKKCDGTLAATGRIIEERFGTVPSLRLDAVVGEAFNLSRTKVKDIIVSGNVSVNAALVESTHFQLSAGDIISTRGYGKFVFYGENGETRKDKIRIRYGMYK